MARVKLTTSIMKRKPVQGGEAIKALIEVLHEGGAYALDTCVAAGGNVNAVAAAHNGITALHALVRGGATAKDTNALRLLLSRGADPNRRNARGETPLLRAVLTFQEDKAVALVEYGADATIPDRWQRTVAMRAEHCTRKEGGTTWATERARWRNTILKRMTTERLHYTLNGCLAGAVSAPKSQRL